MGNEYFIIVIHKQGLFPEIVTDKRGLPLMFDSRNEAEVTASMADGRDGWKTTVVPLQD